jgi:hypothetical protein
MKIYLVLNSAAKSKNKVFSFSETSNINVSISSLELILTKISKI